MSDRIETGAGEVAADEDDLAQAGKQKAGLMGGAVRALGRRIEGLSRAIVDLGDSLRGRIVRGEDRIDALEKAETTTALAMANLRMSKHATRIEALEARARSYGPGEEDASLMGRLPRAMPEVLDLGGTAHLFPMFVRYTPDADMRTAGLTPERVYRVLGRDTRFLRLEGDDGKPVDIAPRFLVAVPGPASTADLDQRDRAAVPCTCGDVRTPGVHRWGGSPCYREGVPPDFLTPPPLARAIGKAVAEGIRFPIPPVYPGRAQPRSLATTEQDAARERAALNLSNATRAIEEDWMKPGGTKDGMLVSLVEGLIMATAEAKRAGVIP